MSISSMPARLVTSWRTGLSSAGVGRQVLKEGIWVTVGQFGAALGLLLGMRLLTEMVPPAVFGEISLLVGVTTFASTLLCIPYLQASLRFYPDLARQSRLDRLRSTVGGTLRRMTAILMICLLLAGLILGRWAGYSFWAFLALALLLAAETSVTFETNLLNAARRQTSLAIWRVVEAWCKPVLAALAVVWLGGTPQAVLLGYVAATAGILFIFLAVGRREGVEPQAANVDETDELARAVRRYAVPLMPLAFVGWISSLSDRYVIAGLLGPAAVGIYAAVYGLMTRPFLTVGGILLMTLRPSYFEAVAAGDQNAERRILRTWVWATAGLCALGVVAVLLLKDVVARIVLAEEYRSAAWLMPILATAFSFMCVSHVLNSVSLAHKRSEGVLYSEVSGAAAALGSGIPLILLYGLWGAAVATALAYLVQLIVAYFLALRLLRHNAACQVERKPADASVCV